MALKTIQTVNMYGDEIQYDCYTKITHITGDKNCIFMEVEHKRFDNQDITVKAESHRYVPEVTETSFNYHKQGYLYLKTLDSYEGAIDC